MAQKYIIGDIVEYDNKVMVVKEPRDGKRFDLSCPKEGLVYCLVDIDEIKPVRITTEILEKNGWEFIGYQMDFGGFLLGIYSKRDILPYLYYYYATKDFSVSICGEVALPDMKYVHQLQHLFFGLGVKQEMEV